MDRTAALTGVLEWLLAFATLLVLDGLCPIPGTARRDTANSATKPSHKVDQRMLDRVRGLLANAESTEFPEEAEALTSRAQELMARHSIDDALLTAAGSGRPGQAGPGQASGRRL